MSNDNETTGQALVQVPGSAMALGETAASAQAAKAQAQALARYAMAERHPRNWHDVRTKLLAECERPRFAEQAKYRIPFKQWNREERREEVVHVIGLSIRFAESAARMMGNVDIATPTTYDDADKRIIQVSATDLESNITFGKDITVMKTIERKKLKRGQVPIEVRKNSYGDDLFILPATEQEVAKKAEAEASKALRTCLLRLLPADIKEECEEAVERTIAMADKADPDAALKRIVSAFHKLGVSAADLEGLLGHSLAGVIPSELDRLRGYHVAMADGLANWPQIVELEGSEEHAGTKDDPMASTRKAVQNAIATSKKKAEARKNGRKRKTEPKKAEPSKPKAEPKPEPKASEPVAETVLTADEVAQGWEMDEHGEKVPPVGHEG
jgi:hypothetical protein